VYVAWPERRLSRCSIVDGSDVIVSHVENIRWNLSRIANIVSILSRNSLPVMGSVKAHCNRTSVLLGRLSANASDRLTDRIDAIRRWCKSWTCGRCHRRFVR
jgi:hypothetical protein